MIVKRKLFSFIDEDGNLGYYLYNESTGEEKLFSVVEEEEREFASVRHLKKAANKLFEKGIKGEVTAKDIMRINKLKGKNSLKALENPNYEKVAKGNYNNINKLTKKRDWNMISKPKFVDQSRQIAKQKVLANKNARLNKGDVKSAVELANMYKDAL